jgi:TRAP-type transport system small permease protein
MKLLGKIIDGFQAVSVVFAMVCLTAMVCITILGVFLRYVLNTGLQWGEEITLVLVIWFTFIALAMGISLGLHININILPQRLPAWIQKALSALRSAVILITGIVFLVYGIILVRFTSRSILPATMLPSSIMYLPVPIAGVYVTCDSILGIFGIDRGKTFLETKFLGER